MVSIKKRFALVFHIVLAFYILVYIAVKVFHSDFISPEMFEKAEIGTTILLYLFLLSRFAQ